MSHEDRIRQLIASGRLGEALTEAEAAVMNTNDTRVQAGILYQAAKAASMQGDWKRTEEIVDRAMQLINGSNPEADLLRAGLLERRAFVRFRQGRLEEARKEADIARLSLVPSDESASVLADLHNTLAGIAWWEGARDEAVAHLRESLEAYHRAGDERGRANTAMNLGILLYSTGRWNEAAAKFKEAERIRRDCGFLPGRAANLLNLGVLQMSMGDLAHARRSFEDSRKLSIEAGEDFDTIRAELGLAQVALAEDKFDDANARLDAALAKEYCLCNDDSIQAEWLKALVECGRGAGEPALELAQRALAHARKASLPETEADACIAVGIAAGRCGRLADAEAALLDAERIASRLGDPYRRALALVELSEICDRVGNARSKTDGCRHADEAARLFSDLGVTTAAERAHALRIRLEGR